MTLSENHFIHPDNRIDRRANLMRHIGQELGLDLFGNLQFILFISKLIVFHTLHMNNLESENHTSNGKKTSLVFITI